MLLLLQGWGEAVVTPPAPAEGGRQKIPRYIPPLPEMDDDILAITMLLFYEDE
jgi:hypothetical protein